MDNKIFRRQSTWLTKIFGWQNIWPTKYLANKIFGRQTIGQQNIWPTQMITCHMVYKSIFNPSVCRPNICRPNVFWLKDVEPYKTLKMTWLVQLSSLFICLQSVQSWVQSFKHFLSEFAFFKLDYFIVLIHMLGNGAAYWKEWVNLVEFIIQEAWYDTFRECSVKHHGFVIYGKWQDYSQLVSLKLLVTNAQA